MLFRRSSSRDEKYYTVEFVCDEMINQVYNIYLDGFPLSRAFLSETEVNNLETKLWNLISSGRLIIKHKSKDYEKKKEIHSISINKYGRNIKVKLSTKRMKVSFSPFQYASKTVDSKSGSAINMFPISLWRMTLKVKEYVESHRFQDFLDLVESTRPLSEERGITEFDGKSVHPISTRTILSEFKIYSKGIINRQKKDCRTLILLDRSLSMINPWSPWDNIPKIEIAQFIAKIIQYLQFNNHLFSFGEDVREEEDPYLISANDQETRLDLALKEAVIFNPEFLIVITDGRPVYSKGVPTERMSRECIHLLDALSRSGVNILIVMLGRDPDMLSFYEELNYNSNLFLLDLSVENHGLIKMVHTIARYIGS